ncbi:hypothetical protein HYH96_04770 [Clostridium botulinum]|uniref:DUF5659 domain-containing protein n=1 Tax=Clostridium botulinum TaxID=1491 RepID=A0A846JC14_CLOBO|nr:hypothetical protein [Clostridium botulinum]ACA54552.1 hypothetical protein CLK_0874 [Clostridium botulinum A3 str. Loch Maree]MBD5643206.1 hypothetical protein [Clostridium botulinum]NFH66853.1 hypothetical protein [Clostridium botulinum]NFJ10630.1 hypothetical protein [Clostridium botulinum]NFK15550.1 hypothetical protein [Clostridium botulinum]
MEEIKIINRGKIAFLYMNDVFEKDIQLIFRNGQYIWAFVFNNNEKVHRLLQEYDTKNDLKKYNNCFKHIALAIKKKKMEE